MQSVLAELEKLEAELGEKVKKIMMIILISLIQVFQSVKMTAKTLKFRNMASHLFLILKFHIIQISWKDLMNRFRQRKKGSWYGFYYLMGDIARLHSAVISYARDFND